ncbi:hypothetical protein Poly51_23810 [Rubripirellula tenax]|uniref:Uncharacterized protein n=1 Tax=Rubripirellula tenax TaxID=2528015 RepID=A0A5C6F796_9BACT|nr:hypothetical protein [Rubripirellula tenax]TWU56470.1 hypothetical protein Poly51_23810 [Rubripirellula tenax]
MFDHEGSRVEFLKILAEMGEEPAFIARARAPEVALTALLKSCEIRRAEMLLWPRRHFTALRRRVSDDWDRLAPLLIDSDSQLVFNKLATELPDLDVPGGSLLPSDKKLLRAFLESAGRFNTAWLRFLDVAGLDKVNRLRDDYNQYYPMEKSCAFGSDTAANDFTPLPTLAPNFLTDRFPPLAIPSLA